MGRFTSLWMAALTVAFVIACSSSSANAQDVGDLKLTFKYGGDDVPKLDDIQPNTDVEFCGKHDLKDRTLVVNPENMGIANVVVAVYTGRGGVKADLPKAEPKIVELSNTNCEFVPHVVIAQAGDTLKVLNPDPVGHNANLNFFANKAQNPLIPAGKSVDVELKKAEPGIVEINCNLHKWMMAKIAVLDHPFAAASDKDGVVTIKGIPAGKTLAFRVNHERASIKEVTFNGEKEKWKRGVFKCEVKPGMNDLGTVIIGKDQFR